MCCAAGNFDTGAIAAMGKHFNGKDGHLLRDKGEESDEREDDIGLLCGADSCLALRVDGGLPSRGSESQRRRAGPMWVYSIRIAWGAVSAKCRQ